MDLQHINILADPSLALPITEIAKSYSRHHGDSISASFSSTLNQSDNIVSGGEADIFITTRQDTLNTLKTQGLIDVYSQTPIIKNRLTLSTYISNSFELILIPKLPLSNILQRIDPGFSFVIGDPDFLNVGVYGLKALRNYDMMGDLEPHFLFMRSTVDMHKTIGAKGGYGLIYQSEAKRNPNIKILGTFPEIAHSSIIYYAVVVAGENMDGAREFLSYLQSQEALDIFSRHHFDVLQTLNSDNGHLARGSISSESINPL